MLVAFAQKNVGALRQLCTIFICTEEVHLRCITNAGSCRCPDAYIGCIRSWAAATGAVDTSEMYIWDVRPSLIGPLRNPYVSVKAHGHMSGLPNFGTKKI